MESKVIVFEFSKEFADNSIDFAYHCKMRFTIAMCTQEQLKGHHVLIRNVEDLVVGDIVKVRITYERYRLDEEFFVPHKNPMHSFTFDTSGHNFNFDAFRANIFHTNS